MKGLIAFQALVIVILVVLFVKAVQVNSILRVDQLILNDKERQIVIELRNRENNDLQYSDRR